MDIFKTLILDTPDTLSNISGILPVSNGGTGADNAPDARVNLLPSYTGNANKVLSLNGGATDVEWTSNGAGDVVGPASSTDNAVVRYDGTTGKLVQDSGVTIDDSGNLTVDGLIGTINGTDIDMDSVASGQLKLDGAGYAAAIALNAQGVNLYTNSASRDVIFGTNEVERMRIDGSGNVGIGTTSPDSYGKLTVNDTAAKSVYIRSTSTNFSGLLLENTNSATKWQIGVEGGTYNTAGKLNIGIDGVGSALMIDASRNVGIGTASPGTKLHVQTATNGGIVVNDGTVNGIIYGSTTLTNSLAIGTTSNHPLIFGTNNTFPQMTLATSGNVGIGTSSPQGHLHINTESAEATEVYIDGENNQQKSVELRHYDASEASGAGRNTFYLKTKATDKVTLGGYDNSSSEFEVVTFQENGKVGIGTTSPNSKVTSVQTFGDGFSSSFYANPASSAQGERSGYSFAATFEGTGDNTARRSADIYSGFNGGAWSNEYLAFGVGLGGASNDAGAATTERMRITGAGNVGIGTASPAVAGAGKSTLDVNGPVLARGGVSVNQTSAGGLDVSGNDLRIRSWGATAGTGSMSFRTGGGGGSVDAEAIRITSTGKVGIGTSSPSDLLELSSAADTTLKLTNTNTSVGDAEITNSIIFQTNDASTGGTGETGYIKHISENSYGSQFGLAFGASNNPGPASEKMRISGSGDVIIGGTTLPAGSNDAWAFDRANSFVRIGRSTTGSASQMRFYNPNGEVGSISTSGSATAYNTSSDRRLKTNIVDVPEELTQSVIDAIDIRSFEWRVDGKQDVGVIAQELAAAHPALLAIGAVSVGDDSAMDPATRKAERVAAMSAAARNEAKTKGHKRDVAAWEEGKTLERDLNSRKAVEPVEPTLEDIPPVGEVLGKIWSVDYSKLVPFLISYSQQLKAENELLKARMDSIEARLNALETP